MLCLEPAHSNSLRIPTIGTPFHLHSDASRKDVRITLGQLDEQGVEQPLAFASQKLSDPQMGWGVKTRTIFEGTTPVSYTHLTLPTILRV